MVNYFTMYVLVMLDSFKSTLEFIVAVSTVWSFIICFLYIVGNRPKHIKKVLLTSVTSILLITFLPSTKQMSAIIILPSIINNEQVQQVPDKVLNLGLAWLEELKPVKK